MGRDELASDERFRTHRARGLHQRELDDLIACWTAEHGVAEIEALMVKHGVPAGRIFGAREMLDDEQFAAREALVRVDSPRWGIFHMQNAFPKLSVTPSGVRTLAPAAVGEDNDDVYRGLLGMSVDELAVLRDKAVI